LTFYLGGPPPPECTLKLQQGFNSHIEILDSVGNKLIYSTLYTSYHLPLSPYISIKMESAADKQKRLIQQEIAKLSGKLVVSLYWTRGQKLINQEQSPDTDKADHHAPHPTQHQDLIHMHQEVIPEAEEGVGEEVDTHWI
jgi:hypothetical protein